MKKFLLLFLLFSLVSRSWAQAPTFRLQKIIGPPISNPSSIAVDRNGYLYMLDGNRYVTKLHPNGRDAQQLDITQGNISNSAMAMDVDAAGNVYLLGSSIRKLAPDGTLLLQFGSIGTGPGQLVGAQNLAVDATGNTFVADNAGDRLVKYNANGTVAFIYSGVGTGAIADPIDVALDTAGNIYVVNEQRVIIKLDPSGQFVQRITLAATPSYQAKYLAVDSFGNFYLSHYLNGTVDKYSSTGTLLGALPAAGSSGRNSAVCVDSQGYIYSVVPDAQIYSSKLYKFNPNGTLLRRWGNINHITSLTQDEAGNFYHFDLMNRKVSRYSRAGQLTLQFGTQGPADGQFQDEVSGLAVDAFGNMYTLEIGAPGRIQKFDARGQFVAKYQSFGNTTSNYYNMASLTLDPAGNMYVWDYAGNSGVRKLDAQGVSVRTFGTAPGQVRDRRAFTVDIRGNVYIADYNGHRVRKFNPTGQLTRTFSSLQRIDSSYISCTVGLAVDGAGNVYASNSNEGTTRIYAADGSSAGTAPRGGDRLSVNRRGTRLLTTYYYTEPIHVLTSVAEQPENLIYGTVFQDFNNNCVRDANEPPLPGIVTVAQPGGYYGVSDESGAYTISVDTGTYQVEQLLPTNEPGRVIAYTCPPPAVVRLSAFYGNSIIGPDFGNQVSTQPYLTASVASNRRRRCFRNQTTVAYANTGFAAANNAQVTVALPPQVRFIAASAPHTVDAQGNYLFQVGTLQAGQQGSITIIDSVACGDPTIRGLTVCTKAWITPTNTYPAPPGWNRASITVQGHSQANNEVRFALHNTGQGATTDSLGLALYQGTQLALRHRFLLPAGDSLVLRVPATSAVVRLEAEQPTSHPFARQASATVEVPGLRTAGAASPAMLAFPPNGHSPDIAEDCQPIIDSFDPNDKQVVPVGVSAQHFTPTNTALRYQIRFQNTGTDVAYRVEVQDTLSADLDLRTLRIGAVSHPYRYTISGHTRPILRFIFENINLPDSASNPAGSNGYVQFSVQPKAGLPDRAAIENNADIFFDYNPPVRTNTTINRIHDLPPVVTATPPLRYDDVLTSPTVLAATPNQGRPGTTVTLTGRRFAATVAGNRVIFNGVPATVVAASAGSLTVRVPLGATTGKIRVVTSDGSAQSPLDFVVFQAPTLQAATPNEAVPGTIITLSGTHFSPLAAQDTVTFNGVGARVVQASATSLQVEVPNGATLGNIRIRTLGGSVESTTPFRVWYSPTVTGFSPSKGRAGTLLTLTGTNFATTATRNLPTIGGRPALVTQATPSTLQVRVPSDAESGPVQVQTPGGSATSTGSFTFIPAPDIISFTPESGSTGAAVTLTGRHFTADSQPDTVYFEGVPAPVLSATATSLVVEVPRGARSGAITVAGAGGRTLSARPFTVAELPAQEAVSVYPNPTHGAFTVSWKKAAFEVRTIRVYNTLGALLQQSEVDLAGKTALTLALRAQRPGFYLVVLDTSQGPLVKRLTIL